MIDNSGVGLALVDFISVAGFLVGAGWLTRLAWRERGRGPGALMLAGTGLVFLGGFLKAIWKLLLAVEVGDLHLLSDLQFVLQAPGYLAMLLAVLGLVWPRRLAAGPLLAIAPWKIPFLVMMTLCSLGASGLLAYLAWQRRAPLAAAAFGLAVVGLLAMGALAGRVQTLSLQWVEEAVNAAGQLSFACGSYWLGRRPAGG